MDSILTLALRIASLCATHSAFAAPPPKILFIYVEDLGYDTGERGLREPNARIAGLATPNLDKLAAESVNFTRALCG